MPHFVRGCCEAVMVDWELGVTTAHSKVKSFKQYHLEGWTDTINGHYVEVINQWLTIIDRSQLFIMNMRGLIQSTSDRMERIRQFLELEKGWGNVELPHDNDSSHLSLELDCWTYDQLKAKYDEMNDGLLDLINKAHNRPPEEPPFFPFDNTRPGCVE